MGLFADEMVEMVQAENLYTSGNYDGYTYTHTHTHTTFRRVGGEMDLI